MNLHEQRMLDLIHFTRTHDTEPYGCSIYNESGEKLIELVADTASPINHAETMAINLCAAKFPDIQWNTLTLYTTGEPCCMCAAACCWANLKEVVYSTDIILMNELWGLESTIHARDIIKTYPKQPHLFEHICKDESDQMFIDFKDKFRQSWNAHRWPLDD